MNNLLTSEQLANDFPFLKSGIAFLDNAASTQKPQVMIDAVSNLYANSYANVHRGIYELSEAASEQYEQVRDQARALLNAQAREEIVFTSGTTMSLNMAARLLAQTLKPGDEIILTRLEHHANLVPWQMVAKECGLKLKFLELNDDEQIDPADLKQLLTPHSRILSLTHISNASGYVTPVRECADIAHENKMLVVVDAAQSVPHMPVDVQALGADMLAFSAHKMCGPTGVGVLYGRKELLERLQPVFGGGSMIREVNLQQSTWAELPLKFEPGTPNIAGVVGFGAALAYLEALGLEAIHSYIRELSEYAWNRLSAIDGLTIHGPADQSVRHSIFSFSVKGLHPHDIASILDQERVAVRAGHHCAQPMMARWKVPATTRASLYLYNTTDDIHRLEAGIHTAMKTLL